MKNLQILIMCCFLVLLTACGREDGGTAQTPVASEEITESITQMPDEQESEAMPENMELGITVNDVYYPIPVSLKQLTEDGWKISGQTPYFLEPFVGEEYYEMRADWSLTEDGQGILPGGSIIRLLEKDGVLLEVTITNQVSTGADTPSQKIEDGVVDSMVVFYDEKHTSIKLDNQELNHVTQNYLIERYPSSDGWTHLPNTYSDHPEFGISTEYTIENDLNQYNNSITIYFDLENRPFKVSVWNETPLDQVELPPQT